MNMPALPVTSSSPPPADALARGAGAADTPDTPVFSNVLTQQQDATSTRPAGSQPAHRHERHEHRDAAARREPPGPDETLSLILDTAALPLMQTAPTELRQTQAGMAGHADAIHVRTARRPSPDEHTSTVMATEDLQADVHTAEHVLRLSENAVSIGNTRLPQLAGTLPAHPGEPAAPSPTGTRPRPQTPDPTSTVHVAVEHTAATAPSLPRPGIALHGAQPTPPDAVLATALAPSSATLLANGGTPAAPMSVTVPTPLSEPQWPQDFSRQILSLTQSLKGSGHTVQMHVNPPELGPIRITLHVGDAIAQASFVSPHASVRQTLENALPHLQQQLAQAGLSLGHADVGDQQPGQHAYDHGHPAPGRQDDASFSLDGLATTGLQTAPATLSTRTTAHPDALVDTFA